MSKIRVNEIETLDGKGEGLISYPYEAGIEITTHNTIVRDRDYEYKLSESTHLPYVTTGTGLPENGAFVPVGDSALRQELSNPSGSEMVGYQGGSVADKLDDIVSGAVTEPLVDAKVATHNEDVNAHPDLHTRIVSDVSAHVTSEADRAEAARDAAFVNAGVFDSVEDGLAATADGDFFTVIGAGDNAVSIYKRISASDADLAGSIPSSALVHGITQYYDSSAFNIEGFIYSYSGNLEPSVDYHSTDYIPVEELESYSVSVYNQFNSANAWYDKDKNYISGFAVNESTIVQAPQSARFIRLSTRNASLADALFRSVEPRINITRLKEAINNVDLSTTSDLVQHEDTNVEDVLRDSSVRFTDIERKLDDPLHGNVVVTTEDERNSQTIIGEDNHAWPPGRRVYDEGLRSEIYADGIWWRMPDGTPADIAERTYVYPSFDEVRANLPTYATAHAIIAEPTLENWVPTRLPGGAAHGDVSIDDSRGFEGVRVDLVRGGTGGVIYQKGSPLTIHRYLIFNLYSKERASFYNDIIRVALINSAGDTLFLKNITRGEFGAVPEVFKASEQLMHIEMDTLDFVPQTDDTTFDNVTGMRVEATRNQSSEVSTFWFDRIETASFRPCVTLRFDDAHESVYTKAFQIMNSFGFKGLTAVITEGVGRPFGCTKEQLLELQDAGWDLVSHAASNPSIAMDTATADEILFEMESSKRYLKEELGAPLIARSCYVAPYNNHPRLANKIAYKFYDCKIGGPHLNSSMPRRPVGYANIGGSWNRMGASSGDGRTAAQLISAAQEAIDKQGWQLFMFHEVADESGPLSPVLTAEFTAFCQWLYDNRVDVDVVTFSEQVNRMEGV